MNSLNWEGLKALATKQKGYFALDQGKRYGVTKDTLAYNIEKGRIERVYPKVYRFMHFPPGENEDLISLWLRTGRKGVFSHQTALAHYDICDIFPNGWSITLPYEERRRWKNVKDRPKNTTLYFHDIPKNEIRKKGVLSFTTPARTLRDYTGISGDPEILLQALVKGLSLGLFTAFQVAFSSAYVLPYLLAQRP